MVYMVETLTSPRVRATQAIIKHFSRMLAESKNALIHHPTSSHRIQKVIDETLLDIYACTHPVIEPNDDTVQGVAALSRFAHLRC